MSEDIGNVEAELEALMAALALAGTVAERVRRDALRLARHLRQDPPRSRQEWADRAQLQDRDGRDLGWLDTSQARRVDLADPTGANDRNVPEKQPTTAREQQGPGELVELEGQFFEVHAAARQGAPEQVRPISLEDAQARLAEHRPDLNARMVGDTDPRLEISRMQTYRASGPASVEDGLRRHPSTQPVAEGHEAPGDASAGAGPRADEAAGGRRSAAEAFGAASEPAGRGRDPESGAAPSAAELTAVGATKPAETSVHR